MLNRKTKSCCQKDKLFPFSKEMQVRMKCVELVEMQRKKSARQIKSNSKSTNVTKRGGGTG
jgi:hypothetical protein